MLVEGSPRVGFRGWSPEATPGSEAIFDYFNENFAIFSKVVKILLEFFRVNLGKSLKFGFVAGSGGSAPLPPKLSSLLKTYSQNQWMALIC